jgi:type II secretory pathway pseudopilin PulG
MQLRTLVTFAVIGIMLVVGAQSLLAVTNIINTSNNQFLQQVFATHMETATSNEKTVVHQGLIASGPNPQIKPEPNEGRQSAVILPYRSDGSIYRGIITFTATKPVEVTFSHRIPIDNTTLSQLNVEKHGKLFVRHLTAFPGNLSAPSRIIPDYRGGSTSPYFSASIPFVGSDVVLRTNGEPFIVSYDVSADIVKPKIINHLENATLSGATTATNTTVR